MTSFQTHPSAKLIRALYGISREKNAQVRAHLLEASLREVLRWFTLTARQLLQGIIHIPHQTQRFFQKHKGALSQLADPRIDPRTKKQIILTPGGSGSLGGVMIRSLLKWDPNAQAKKTKSSPKKKKNKKSPKKRKPSKRNLPGKKKSPTSGTKRKRGTAARTQTYTRKTPPQHQQQSPVMTRSPLGSPSSLSSSSSSPRQPFTMMPAKPDLRHVFPNLMQKWKPISKVTTSGPSTSTDLAMAAAANKVPSPKTKVQERTGVLQSLVDLSKQELRRFSPLKTPQRRVRPVMKMVRHADNKWGRVPV